MQKKVKEEKGAKKKEKKVWKKNIQELKKNKEKQKQVFNTTAQLVLRFIQRNELTHV